MFLIDDILFSPFAGLLYVFRELHEAVRNDSANEAEAIRVELSELYMLLETSRITEAQADAREKELLDRLEELDARRHASGEDGEDEEEEDDVEDDDAVEDEEEDEETEEPLLVTRSSGMELYPEWSEKNGP